jgi:hypothetical protein
MVLSLKTWKSRSLPGLRRTEDPHHDECMRGARRTEKRSRRARRGGFLVTGKRAVSGARGFAKRGALAT